MAKYKRQQKRLTTIIEEMKKIIFTKEGKLERYRHEIQQYRQNRMFYLNKSKFHRRKNLERMNKRIVKPDSSEVKFFWGYWYIAKNLLEKSESLTN